MIKCEITNKIHNIHLTIKDIEKFPQTYKSILGEQKDNKTLNLILRRKLNKFIKNGDIYKTTIPGTRFGKAIFYSKTKEYDILIESGRLGSNVYCFFEYKKQGKFYIQINECWELKDYLWKKIGEKIIFEGNVLKWI